MRSETKYTQIIFTFQAIMSFCILATAWAAPPPEKEGNNNLIQDNKNPNNIPKEAQDPKEIRRLYGLRIRQTLANLCPLGPTTTFRQECRCRTPHPWPNSSCNETCLLSIEPGYVIDGVPDFQTRGDHGQSNYNNIARDTYVNSTQSKIEQYNAAISGLSTIASLVGGKEAKAAKASSDDKLGYAMSSESSRSLFVESRNAAIEINVQARGYVTGWPFHNHRGWEHAVLTVIGKCMFQPTPQLAAWLDEVSPSNPK